MKSVVLHKVRAVGMWHHYGGQLPIEKTFRLEHEPNNPEDKNAVVLIDHASRKRAAYIMRQESPNILSLMHLSRTFVCRPQRELFWLNPDQGQGQECRVGFRINDSDIQEAKVILGAKFEYTIL